MKTHTFYTLKMKQNSRKKAQPKHKWFTFEYDYDNIKYNQCIKQINTFSYTQKIPSKNFCRQYHTSNKKQNNYLTGTFAHGERIYYI